MATKRQSDAERLDVFIPLAPVPPIPLEYAEPDPAKREEAWASFLDFARSSKIERPGSAGTREDWYDEMIDERPR